VIESQPNPITNLEFHLTPILIMLMFHDALSLKQPFSDFCNERIPIAQLPINRCNTCGTRLKGNQWRWRPAIYYFKWCHLQSLLQRCVITKFCPRQPPKPTAQTITCQTSQIDSDDLVSNFRLNIHLRMKCRTDT
jgi:hypothetical protein